MASADWAAASVTDETSRPVHLPGARMGHMAPLVGQPWVGIAANRRSGIGRSRHRVERLVRALEERGLGCSIAWSLDERSQLVTLANQDPSCRCLVAVGGDGTVGALLTGVFAQESLNGIANANGLLFGNPGQVGVQAVAVAAAILYSGIGSFVLLKLVGLVIPLRADAEGETAGLDVSQHGEEAYIHGEGITQGTMHAAVELPMGAKKSTVTS